MAVVTEKSKYCSRGDSAMRRHHNARQMAPDSKAAAVWLAGKQEYNTCALVKFGAPCYFSAFNGSTALAETQFTTSTKGEQAVCSFPIVCRKIFDRLGSEDEESRTIEY